MWKADSISTYLETEGRRKPPESAELDVKFAKGSSPKFELITVTNTAQNLLIGCSVVRHDAELEYVYLNLYEHQRQEIATTSTLSHYLENWKQHFFRYTLRH
jgi:hypothetical protein